MKAVRLSVKEMMIAVGLIGILMGAFRIHLSIGSFLAGVVALATIRARGKFAQHQSEGRLVQERERLICFAKSVGVATLLLAVSSLPAVVLMNDYAMYVPAPRIFYLPIRTHAWRIHYMTSDLIVLFALSGAPISAILRRWIW
ncbi:hypothetical protein TA3x_005686 [Tundrisphaera sp. TA3]|uniref:hypothetical protein n=1 Tax=Tundrisphaera sp. TA3 TaxID=3435775 RepID=UPI003EC0E9AB